MTTTNSWVSPTEVNPVDVPAESLADCNHHPLTDAQVESWRERGFALVQGLLPMELVNACREEAIASLAKHSVEDFGSNGVMEFPTTLLNCDKIPLHPNLVAAASQLLDISPMDLRLIQSDIWPKRGPSATFTVKNPLSNVDQRIHCDYGNNTLLHPPGWYEPESVAMIVYFSDADECGGATAVSPRNPNDPTDPAYSEPILGQPGTGPIEFVNDRECAEEHMNTHHPEYSAMRKRLYGNEVRAQFRVGTVLLYRHDVWHRGTPVNPGKLRIVANLGYTKAECPWNTVWNRGWAKNMYWWPNPVMETIVAQASITQRALLQFPPPGHKYWTEFTIRAVEGRYGAFGFDATPYRKALGFHETRRDSKASEK